MNRLTRFLALPLFACAVFSQTSFAQTIGDNFTDRITNPGFEGGETSLIAAGSERYLQPDGWTLTTDRTGWRDVGLNTTSETTPSNEGQKYYNVWSGGVKSLNVNQKITLPAGKYKLTAAMRMTDPRPEYITDQHIYATTADGVTYKSSILTEKGIGIVTGQNENEEDIVDRTRWDTLTVVFNSTKEQLLTIGAASSNTTEGTSAGWFQIDNFQLSYVGAPGDPDINDILAVFKTKIAAIDQAGYSESNIPPKTYYDLIDLVNQANAVNSSTSYADASAIMENLTTAMEAAEQGKTLYANLLLEFEKAERVPNTYIGFAEYDAIVGEGLDIIADSEADNAAFESIIAKLKQGYYDVNYTEMGTATGDDAKDATWLIANPNYTKDGGSTSVKEDGISTSWTSTWTYIGWGDQWIGQGVTLNGPTEDTQVNAYNYNGWNYSNIEMKQAIANLPEGTYSLSCSFHTYSAPGEGWIYAKSSYEEQKMSPSYKYDEAADPATPWWEVVSTEKLYVGSGDVLNIGYFAQRSDGFCGVNFTGWKLTYYGKAGSADKLVEELVAQAETMLNDEEILITPVEKKGLQDAVDLAAEAADKSVAVEPLQTGIANAEASTKLYASVNKEYGAALDYLSEGDSRGASEADYNELLGAINTLESTLEKDTTSRFALSVLQGELHKAIVKFQFKLTKLASEGSPVDVTPGIVNPTIEVSGSTTVPNGWTASVSGSANYTNGGQHYSGNTSDRYIDSYNGTAGTLKYTIKQTIAVPNGTYILKCAGRSSGDGAYLYAIGSSKNTAVIINNGSTGGGIQESGEYTSNEDAGYGWNWIVINGIEVTDRTIEIGVTCDPEVSGGDAWTGTWFSADDFTLMCTEGEGYNAIEEQKENIKATPSAGFYVENGYIKSKNDEPFTVTSISGIEYPASSQLLPGSYIVKTQEGSFSIFIQ